MYNNYLVDNIIINKIKIWNNLPINYKKNEYLIKTNYVSIILFWKNNCIILKEIIINKEFRGRKIFTNLIIELEKLNQNIKIQSIFNRKLFKTMIKKKWKPIDNNWSVFYNSKINHK